MATILHPVLQDLHYKRDDKKRKNVSALDVLNELLVSNAISPEAVRRAHAKLRPPAPNAATETTSTKTPSTVRRRHIALHLYYDGAIYSGLAQNVGQEHDNSIEQALFAALRKAHLVEDREGYSRCGRTDKGVSALGQVIALPLKSAFHPEASLDPEGTQPLTQLPNNSHQSLSIYAPSRKGRIAKEQKEYAYDKILNNLLPPDIRILGWAPVSDEFSARFSATSRTYRYFFRRRSCYDLDRMREGMSRMVGTHDFRNFCKMDVEQVYNFERRVDRAEVVEKDREICYFLVVGQAFLWHQIRNMASVLFSIGRGDEEPSVVDGLLDVKTYPGKPHYPMAVDKPLVLHHCGYPNLEIGYSVTNLWTLSTLWEAQWEELSIAAARIRNAIESLDTRMVSVSDVDSFVDGRLNMLRKKKQIVETVEPLAGRTNEAIVSWTVARKHLADIGWNPDDQDLFGTAHVPILERETGPSYDEKIALLQSSDRRRRRYEENIVKKRKTQEEDQAFYTHKTQQGGSGLVK